MVLLGSKILEKGFFLITVSSYGKRGCFIGVKNFRKGVFLIHLEHT